METKPELRIIPDLHVPPGGPGQVDLPDRGRDSGTIRQEHRQRVRHSLSPQLQQGRPDVEVLAEPSGEHGESNPPRTSQNMSGSEKVVEGWVTGGGGRRVKPGGNW